MWMLWCGSRVRKDSVLSKSQITKKGSSKRKLTTGGWNNQSNPEPDFETVSLCRFPDRQYIPNHPKFDPATCKIVSASDKISRAFNISSLSIVFCGLALMHQSSHSAQHTSKQEEKRHSFAYVRWYQLFNYSQPYSQSSWVACSTRRWTKLHIIYILYIIL